MKVLVTGASGFVGRALCAKLLISGHQVVAAQRTAANTSTAIEWVVTGDLGDPGDLGENKVWQQALRNVDVVIHLSARVHVMHEHAEDSLKEFRCVNVAGTEHLARLCARNSVKRFIYLSSIKVNGEATSADIKFSEGDVPAPEDAYAISKLEAEQALHVIAAETGLEVVIVRPPLVYGAGVKGNFAQLLKTIAKGIPLPLASVRNLRSLIYVENLVDVLGLCAIHPAAAGQTYLVNDGEDVSISDLLRLLGEAMEHSAHLFPCPVVLLKMAAYVGGKTKQVERVLGTLQVDSNKIRRELGWLPPFTLKQGLRATADWYRSTHL
ncbi:MAG: UDP-glucose 4-epimerase family protein [Methylophilaceae bacterium]